MVYFIRWIIILVVNVDFGFVFLGAIWRNIKINQKNWPLIRFSHNLIDKMRTFRSNVIRIWKSVGFSSSLRIANIFSRNVKNAFQTKNISGKKKQLQSITSMWTLTNVTRYGVYARFFFVLSLNFEFWMCWLQLEMISTGFVYINRLTDWKRKMIWWFKFRPLEHLHSITLLIHIHIRSEPFVILRFSFECGNVCVCQYVIFFLHLSCSIRFTRTIPYV